MIDFKKQEENIINYVTENYGFFLNNFNIKPPKITAEFLDFDKYKNDFVCYIEFDNSAFSDRFNDDCTKTETLYINVYLAHRNNTPEKLNSLMLNSTSAFYNMIHIKEMKNIIKQTVNKADFFKYIEGANNIFCGKLSIELIIEL